MILLLLQKQTSKRTKNIDHEIPEPESRPHFQESVRRASRPRHQFPERPPAVRDTGRRNHRSGIPESRTGATDTPAQGQHRGRALQGPYRAAIHRGNADDVDFGLQTTRTVQRLESVRQPTGQRRRLPVVATGLLAEPRKRHILGQRDILSRLPDRGSGRHPRSHRRTALHLHRTAQVHAEKLWGQEDASALASLPD